MHLRGDSLRRPPPDRAPRLTTSETQSVNLAGVPYLFDFVSCTVHRSARRTNSRPRRQYDNRGVLSHGSNATSGWGPHSHHRRATRGARQPRSSRSSRATAPARTSGAPASACSTRRWRRPTAASARSPGTRCWPARRRSTRRSNWLPDETVAAFKEYLVGIKGPLTTPIGGGIRSLNVALRQLLDLYVCLRPVRYFKGVPSPVKRPEQVDMVIFRENTEDIYAGIEWAVGQPRGEEGHRLPAGRDEGHEDPLPGDQRHRHQAGLARRARSGWSAPPSSTRCARSAAASPWCTRATS